MCVLNDSDNCKCVLIDSDNCKIVPFSFQVTLHNFCKKKVKVKLSRYMPRQALGIPGGWGSRISRRLAQEGGKVVSPTHRPSLPPETHNFSTTGRVPSQCQKSLLFAVTAVITSNVTLSWLKRRAFISLSKLIAVFYKNRRK